MSSRSLRILLVKPKPRLRSIVALHGFQILEPIELGYIAASVPPQHDVRAIDLRFAAFPLHALRRELGRYGPDIVGITGYTHESRIVKELAHLVRETLPKTKVVVGGHHATVAAADYDIPDIDAIVRGEGCEPFRQIVVAIAHGDDLASVAGVLVPGKIDASALEGWPRFPDVSTLPSPRRDLWPAKRYYCAWAAEDAKMFSRLFPTTSMVRSSFGCRMRCSFCIVPKLFNGKHHPRPAEAVAEEIARVPSDHVYFCDDENFIDEKFAHELAAALEKRGVKKRYFAWTRSTTVNRHPDLFRRWRPLGLDAAFLGFEYSSDEQLKASRKGSTVAENEKAHTTLRSIGIAVHAAFMITPDYSEDDFARLRTYVGNMPPAQFSFTVCTPSPGTDDYVAIENQIWTPDAYDLHDCMHPLTRTTLPLKRFCAAYSQQLHEASLKNPRRAARRAVHPSEMLRIALVEGRYERAYANMYRDYPRELWA